MQHYDYIFVGAGLYFATIAHAATKIGKKCLIIEKRAHIGGNIYTTNVDGINVHEYGAHIFHTDNKDVWDYVNTFAKFNRYTNCPVENYKGTLYNLPFNMNTFTKLRHDVITPKDVQRRIATQIIEKMLEGCGIQLNTDFFDDKEKWLDMADKIIYTSTIDKFFDY